MIVTVRHFRKAVRVSEYIVVTALILLGLILAAGANPAAPIRTFAVISGSMAPAIPRGALVLVRRADIYGVGDIVTAASGDPRRPVTHRIVAMTDDGRYLTRGDANPAPDPSSRAPSDIIGRVRFWVPWVGYPVALVMTVQGFIFLVVIPGTLIAFCDELLALSATLEKRLRPSADAS